MRRVAWALGLACVLAGLSAQGQLGPSLDPPYPCVALRVRVPAEAAPGEKLTYRITAENTTRADAHHVLVKATLPKGAAYLDSSPPADDTGPPAAVWRLGTLKAGERRELTLTIRPEGDGDVDLCARVQFEHGQCVKTRIARPGLNFRRIGPTTAVKFDIPRYTLEVTNTGKGVARDVVIEETFPDGLDFQAVDDKDTPPAGNFPTYTWKVGDVAPGARRVIRYGALVQKNGDFTIKGEARSGATRREATTTLRVGEPRIEVKMSGPQKALKAQVVTYRATVINSGSAPLTNVRLVSDFAKIPNIEFVGATGGGRLTGGEVAWSLGTIPAGAQREVTFDVKVTSLDEKVDKIWNFKNVCTATADRGLREQGSVTTAFTAG